MSAKVSSFEKVKLGDYNYLFFLVAWNDYETSVKQEIDKNFEKFGENIGVEGLIVQAYDRNKWETGDQIIRKDWGNLNERIQNEQEPFLLIIDTDFAAFNPQKNNWAIIWFNDYFEDKESIPQLFFTLQKKLKRGENLFEHFNSVKNNPASKAIIREVNQTETNQSFVISNKAYVDGTFEDHFKRIRKAISDGNTRKGISYLKEIETEYSNEVFILSSRFENVKLEAIRGTINKEEEYLQTNKISLSVLDLISKMEEENKY